MTSMPTPLTAVLPLPTLKVPSLPGAGIKPRTEAETRAAIGKTAKDFETQVLSSMLQSMFEQMPASEEFGGGDNEQMFRSFLADGMARQTVKHSSIGLSDQVARQMLQMQGLAPK
jgi:flagellar protein FlgJ